MDVLVQSPKCTSNTGVTDPNTARLFQSVLDNQDSLLLQHGQPSRPKIQETRLAASRRASNVELFLVYIGEKIVQLSLQLDQVRANVQDGSEFLFHFLS
jgi:hypothetical protein